jgi:hypothetical protein
MSACYRRVIASTVRQTKGTSQWLSAEYWVQLDQSRKESRWKHHLRHIATSAADGKMSSGPGEAI